MKNCFYCNSSEIKHTPNFYSRDRYECKDCGASCDYVSYHMIYQILVGEKYCITYSQYNEVVKVLDRKTNRLLLERPRRFVKYKLVESDIEKYLMLK